MTEAKRSVVYIGSDPQKVVVLIKYILLALDLKDIDLTATMWGTEGLETVQRVKPNLILLDLQNMDGWEVYEQMKANDTLKHIPIIIVTTESLQEMMRIATHQPSSTTLH